MSRAKRVRKAKAARKIERAERALYERGFTPTAFEDKLGRFVGAVAYELLRRFLSPPEATASGTDISRGAAAAAVNPSHDGKPPRALKLIACAAETSSVVAFRGLPPVAVEPVEQFESVDELSHNREVPRG